MIDVDVSKLRAELYAMVDATMARVFPAPAAPADPAAGASAEPRRMKVGDFARARGYSPRTVTRYCAIGMPHVGAGKARRILVIEADAWIARGGPTVATKAAGAKAHDAARSP